MAIFKNIVIFIATIFFVSSNKKNVLFITVFIGIIYYSILVFLRKVESKIVCHYYDYKYSLVRTFEECIRGAQIIKIFSVKEEFLKRAHLKYENLAAYKLSELHVYHGEELLCNIVSTLLLGIALTEGSEMKMHGRGTAVVATVIFLLMNLSEVMKSIVTLIVHLETFFHLNIQPFL